MKLQKIFLMLIWFALLSKADIFSDTSYQVCFTPYENCTAEIVSIIEEAKKSIFVQAYSFTSKQIIKALVQAKKRGIDVQIIMDNSMLKEVGGSQRTKKYLLKAGIPIWIDYKLARAHNKVIIIDEKIVETGSFNFTYAAQNTNAENLLIINNTELAKKYLKNWLKRQAESEKI